MKQVVLVLKYCNERCPNFYHNYEDKDSTWCAKLGKKIFDWNIHDQAMFDFSPRKIPKECPLEDWNE